MRFKRFLHLFKKHNKNGLPLYFTFNTFDSYWRAITYSNTHYTGFELHFFFGSPPTSDDVDDGFVLFDFDED